MKNGPIKHFKLTKSGKKIPMHIYREWLEKKKAEPNPELNDEVILKSELAWLQDEPTD